MNVVVDEDVITSQADQIRKVLREATELLTCTEIFERAKGFEDMAQVATQLYAFYARGEVTRAKSKKGRAVYGLNRDYKPKRQRSAAPEPHAAEGQETVAPVSFESRQPAYANDKVATAKAVTAAEAPFKFPTSFPDVKPTPGSSDNEYIDTPQQPVADHAALKELQSSEDKAASFLTFPNAPLVAAFAKPVPAVAIAETKPEVLETKPMEVKPKSAPAERTARYAISDDGAVGITFEDGTARLLPAADVEALFGFMGLTQPIWRPQVGE